MNNRYLLPGAELTLKGIDGTFIIREIVGRGSSCVVYRTDFFNLLGERSEHLLKEFNPKCCNLVRDEVGNLLVNEVNAEEFDKSMQMFQSGYRKQEWFRRISVLKNYTASIQNIYYDYNTMYIDMNVTEGVSYANVREKSIYNLARRMKVLAEVVGRYHDEGYLHLDLKPSNIYVRPDNETCEDVLLFDFDSVVKKSEVQEGNGISYTEEWAALEIICSNRRSSICEATDVFSIGEMFFEQLMERHSESWERSTFSSYEYDIEAAIFENVNPGVCRLLDELFTHTLCDTVAARYQSTEELIKTLDEIINISNPEIPYIKSSCPEPVDFFVGREKELEKINEEFQSNKHLFLYGIGGIGKSELAKKYAKQYQKNYDAVIFAPYGSSLMALFADDELIPIYHFFRYPEEKLEDYAGRKLRKLKELCNEHILIIIDNFDCALGSLETKEQRILAEIKKLDCHVLFTTRVDLSETSLLRVPVGNISDKNLFEIFCKYYTKEMKDKECSCIKRIIDIVGGHTLTVELLAKQMMAGRIKPEKMLDTIAISGIGNGGKEKVLLGKDDKFTRVSVQEHIQTLFDLSRLNEEEQYVLKNLSLIPHTGISTERFATWCEVENYDTINYLVEVGWIRSDKEKDYISLHPVIADMIVKGICEQDIDNMLLVINSVEAAKKMVEILPVVERIELSELFKIMSANMVKTEVRSKRVAFFLDEAVKIYKDFDNSSMAILYRKKALEIWRLIYGEMHIRTANCYGGLAERYMRIGNLVEAEIYMKKAHEILLSICEVNSKEMAASHNNLGVLYIRLYQYERAEEHLSKGLQIFKNLYTQKHEDLANSYYNHGLLYHMKGDMKKAEIFYFKAHKMWRALYSEENRKIAMSYISLAEIYYPQIGKAPIIKEKLAEQCAIKGLRISERLYGENHASVAKAYMVYGLVCVKKEKYELAEKVYNKALDITRTRYGLENKQVAVIYNNIGCMHRDMGNMEKAEEYCVQAYKIMLSIYGEDSPDIAAAYSTLGGLYFDMKRNDEALKYYEKAYRIRRRVLGDEHPKTKRIVEKIDLLNAR